MMFEYKFVKAKVRLGKVHQCRRADVSIWNESGLIDRFTVEQEVTAYKLHLQVLCALMSRCTKDIAIYSEDANDLKSSYFTALKRPENDSALVSQLHELASSRYLFFHQESVAPLVEQKKAPRVVLRKGGAAHVRL